MARLRPAIATVSLGRSSAGHSITQKLQAASEFDFEGVEIFFECLQHHARDRFGASDRLEAEKLLAAAGDVRKTCDDLHLEVVCLQPFTFYDGLVDFDAHRQRIEDLKLWFRICKVLGTDLIQIPSNFAMEGTTGDRERLVADLDEAAQLGLAEAPPVRFAYEAISWADHIDLWEQSWEIVQKVNQPNLGLCLDVFHIAGRIWADPTTPSGQVDGGDSALQRSLAHLLRTIDIKKIFYVQLSWKGWVSMEMFNQSHYEVGNDVAKSHAARAQKSWQKLLSKLDYRRPGDSEQLQLGRRIALSGTPISHSLSPIFNHTLWSLIGLSWIYELMETTSLEDLFVELRSGTYVGASITMPHKIKALELVDEVSSEAQKIGAINTVLVSREKGSGERRLLGDNLDWKGMLLAMEAACSSVDQYTNKDIGMVIGAGATARTAVYMMCEHLHISEIYIVNRDAMEVSALVHDIKIRGVKANMIHVARVEDVSSCFRPTVAIGTVPDCKISSAEEEQAREVALRLLNLPALRAATQSCILDMCYSPDPETTQIIAAKKAGWVTVSGVEIVAAINVLQNEAWQGRSRETFWNTKVENHCKMAMQHALGKRACP
ncbi:hypothetical protein LTR78_003422 [Recurvomyces mirabilis]|uniref:3-dehydroshikimate dehydratase n=1 Tax=Recurvomyces mirabilis TaxID=574656 RepID=A0AAE0WRR0_9PEZI|nr:hypothetical protein LTR78_003422 [Recurvomyces mirabilis]KAK5154544.1 hypothetical protein LTS14_006681 [Recurvomyces mirabilis]